MSEYPTILDATAGNRTMWITRESPNILWIDIEPELELKPDMIMDCSNTDFPNNSFHIIFFDPPHSFGRTKNLGIHATPSMTLSKRKWGKLGSYYGFDKFPTKIALLSFINRAQKEFHRILTSGGVLWFKWCEIHSSLSAILPLFKNWDIMIKIEVAYRGKVSKNRTWWIMFMKNMDKEDEN